MAYCADPFNYHRRRTRTVHIGGLTLGGDAPIRLQSMTTADTLDVEATVAESLRMIEAGCELVRITAPSMKEAAALGPIKEALRAAAGFSAPLVADIHFTPNAAELAADFVEKIRVNPGNYADKKKFEEIDYTDATYAAELERIRERFLPLVRKCKALGRAMRIGTNHGSLSDRILSRYGDTPLGMVESALEFLRICREEDYHEVVISMKASNPQVMVQAYRLLVSRMDEEGMDYPLHLGVTEAGEGEDGRIKSAIGIGSLLADGLGNTIRVSLTESSPREIAVCTEPQIEIPALTHAAGATPLPEAPLPWDPFTFKRRTAAEADDAIGAVGLVGSGSIHHLRGGGVAMNAAVDGHVQVAQMGAELRQHRQGRQRAVGDDQGALAALRAQVLGDELARAGAELDGGGEGKTGDAHGGPQMISK